jgi:PilZ domain
MNSIQGRERRRHVRVDGSWPVVVHGIEPTGATYTFAATMLNISVSGILLEGAVTANLWADKPLTIELPGGVGTASAIVRRFVEYGDAPVQMFSRWGVELVDLTIHQRVLWSRFVYTAAKESGHELARMCVHLGLPPGGSAIQEALSRRGT